LGDIDVTLIGTVTLETIGLEVDPVTGRLKGARTYLLQEYAMRILFIASSYYPHIGGTRHVIKSVAKNLLKGDEIIVS
jgi:hypothetical protein